MYISEKKMFGSVGGKYLKPKGKRMLGENVKSGIETTFWWLQLDYRSNKNTDLGVEAYDEDRIWEST